MPDPEIEVSNMVFEPTIKRTPAGSIGISLCTEIGGITLEQQLTVVMNTATSPINFIMLFTLCLLLVIFEHPYKIKYDYFWRS
jgi:hypothetical protein